MEDRSAPLPEGVLDEQLAYYRARAAEYDDWFFRRGRYDRGPDATRAWFAELGLVGGWLDELDLGGRDVLELASGTGLWTRELVDRGARVTAVDAAPEMFEVLRSKLDGRGVECVLADLFEYTPKRRFDAVVSCFFVSHVPDERLGDFVALLAAGTRKGGRVFLVDSLRATSSTAVDHVLPDGGDQTMERVLDDGRRYRVVKRFRDDASLRDALAAAGIEAELRRTPTYFQVVVGTAR